MTNTIRNRAKKFTNYRTREQRGEVDKIKCSKNRSQSKIRALGGARIFEVVKRLRGFTKDRYRGLSKNACRAFTALALANTYLSRRHCVRNEQVTDQNLIKRPKGVKQTTLNLLFFKIDQIWSILKISCLFSVASGSYYFRQNYHPEYLAKDGVIYYSRPLPPVWI